MKQYSNPNWYSFETPICQNTFRLCTWFNLTLCANVPIYRHLAVYGFCFTYFVQMIIHPCHNLLWPSWKFKIPDWLHPTVWMYGINNPCLKFNFAVCNSLDKRNATCVAHCLINQGTSQDNFENHWPWIMDQNMQRYCSGRREIVWRP